MLRTNIAHGKVDMLWCDNCGTLILGKGCSRCNSSGRMFQINSPGDIRPAMGKSNEILLNLFKDAFGTAEPLEGRMIFFNKIAGEDRTDEVIAHGQVIGVQSFDIKQGSMKIELRQPGADLFEKVATKNIVLFTNMQGHLKGKTIPGENIREITGIFSEGNSLIVKKGEKIGPGIALADSSRIKDAERAVKIRDFNKNSEMIISPISDRNVFIESNKNHLRIIESEAISDIKSFIKGKKQPITVSFSGGKDSLAAYGIASKAVSNPDLLFINTGLEFQETLDYVKDFTSKCGSKLYVAEAGNAFWENVDTFGPPAKDFRWCCKTCKLGPITELITNKYSTGVITIEGNRALESFSRANIGFVSKNPFVPNQINLNPVRMWSAAEIWGYIWMRKLEYNLLYDMDFERIGCYLCASCLASEWKNTATICPDKYSEWTEYLKNYAKDKGLSEEYVNFGFWRWKVLPPKMIQLAEGLDLKVKPTKKGKVSLKMLKGASSCTSGGYSVEAIVHLPKNRDFSYVEDMLTTLGDVKYSSEFEIALLRMPEGNAKLFGGGQVSVVANSEKNSKYVFEKAVKALIRADLCTECGICVKGCRKRAIKISKGVRIDPNKCIKCGRCEKSCMVIHYYDKIMEGKD